MSPKDESMDHCLSHSGLDQKVTILLWIAGLSAPVVGSLLITLVAVMLNVRAVLTQEMALIREKVATIKVISTEARDRSIRNEEMLRRIISGEYRFTDKGPQGP